MSLQHTRVVIERDTFNLILSTINNLSALREHKLARTPGGADSGGARTEQRLLPSPSKPASMHLVWSQVDPACLELPLLPRGGFHVHVFVLNHGVRGENQGVVLDRHRHWLDCGRATRQSHPSNHRLAWWPRKGHLVSARRVVVNAALAPTGDEVKLSLHSATGRGVDHSVCRRCAADQLAAPPCIG